MNGWPEPPLGPGARDGAPGSVSSGNGPFQKSQDAARYSMWEMDGRTSGKTMTDSNLVQLYGELEGVELGKWDETVLRWLASYEPSIFSVVCGLIYRARQAEGDTG